MSLETKQEYLLEEIYKKGYDTEDFTRFMDNKREGGGQDLDIWSLVDLKAAVKEYQQTQLQLQAQKQANLSQNQPQQQLTQTQESDDLFVKEVPCMEMVPTQIGTTQDVHIIIESFEKVDTGFFSLSQSYVNYKILTHPFDWNVTRRYSDFEWLREILTKLYPGDFVPPIANKTHTRQFSDAYLGKRLKFLQKFLNHILHSTVLRNDRYFQDFLMVRDDKEFKSIQKAAEKLPKTTKLEKVISPEGKIKLEISAYTDNYFKHISPLLNNFNVSYDNIMKLSKKLLGDFEVLSTTMLMLGEGFEQFAGHVNQFNANVRPEEKNPKLEAAIITLNNMLIIWGKNIANYTGHIQENFRNFFKFHDKEITQMREFLKLREQSQQDYQKFKERLDLKKEKLFQLKETGKWEIPKDQLQQLEASNQISNKKLCMQLMLPKETQSQNDLRDTFAYYNYALYREVQRILNQNVEIYSAHFSSFLTSQTENLTKMHVTWADIKGNLDGLDQLVSENSNKFTIMSKPPAQVV